MAGTDFSEPISESVTKTMNLMFESIAMANSPVIRICGDRSSGKTIRTLAVTGTRLSLLKPSDSSRPTGR